MFCEKGRKEMAAENFLMSAVANFHCKMEVAKSHEEG